MDAIRDGLTMFLVVGVGPLLLLWLLVHPFVGLWRRIGPLWTYVCVGGIIVGAAVLLARTHTGLVAIDFGTDWPLVAAGLVCLAVSAYLRISVFRQLGAKMFIGLPELAPERYPRQLLCEGAYARTRHPRYAQFILGLLGCALIANHLAGYVVWLAWLVGLVPIVWFEERELHQRFGGAYEDYCRRVPRFIPRRRR